MTLTPSRRPAALSASIVFCWLGMVVVSSADRSSRSGFCSLTFSTKVSTATSQPMSVTVKPAAESMEHTIVLPISWMSPATVPATATPRVWRPPPAASMAGCSTATAAFMASAPCTSSGRKNSPLPNRSPTSSMPLTKPLSRMSPGDKPAARPLRASSSASSSSPSITVCAIWE